MSSEGGALIIIDFCKAFDSVPLSGGNINSMMNDNSKAR